MGEPGESVHTCPHSDVTAAVQKSLPHRSQQLASRETGCLDVVPKKSYSKALGFIFSFL